MTTIRVATEADAEEILAIYAKYIEQTAITFEYVVPSIEEFRGRIRIHWSDFHIWQRKRMEKSQAMPMSVRSKRERHMTGQWRHHLCRYGAETQANRQKAL